MDRLKRDTIVDYTAWDLNAKKGLVVVKNRQKLEKIIKRKSRREAKQSLKNMQKVLKNIDCIEINKIFA